MPVTLARGLVTRIIKQLSKEAGGRRRWQRQEANAGGGRQRGREKQCSDQLAMGRKKKQNGERVYDRSLSTFCFCVL
jgi:hypothetical protein